VVPQEVAAVLEGRQVVTDDQVRHLVVTVVLEGHQLVTDDRLDYLAVTVVLEGHQLVMDDRLDCQAVTVVLEVVGVHQEEAVALDQEVPQEEEVA
jgi:hypothetical protein